MTATRFIAWLSLAALLAGCHDGAPATGGAPAAALSATGLLSGDDGAGFARALGPRPFHFPDDHGPHPGFRSEWWYLTGIVQASSGGTVGAGPSYPTFGYQLTIFRQALAPAAPPRASAWAAHDIYMAHLAIADLDGAGGGSRPRFIADERFARDGLGLGGAQVRPFAVWADNWRMDGPTVGDDIFPAHLRAGTDGAAIDLTVGGGRGPIAQGERGLSAKGPQPGNASYYYSCTRLPTRGTIRLAERTFTVVGESWLDREWSTSALPAGVIGWDWLGAHLSDGRDLMIYRLRDAAGGAAAESRATLIAADGTTRLFAPGGFSLTGDGGGAGNNVWQSPHSGVRYPAALRLQIPGDDTDLMIRPRLADQELNLSVRYWEGAAALSGRAGGKPITGGGYLELTGY